MNFKLLTYLFVTATFAMSCNTAPPAPDVPTAEEIAQAMEADKAAIQGLIDNYEKALMEKDPEGCISMFAEGAVFLPNDAEALTGAGILDWYKEIKSRVSDMDIDLKVDEVDVHGDRAFVRTSNSGTMQIGDKTADINSRSLFYLAKVEDGSWKVKTYAFDSIDDDAGDNGAEDDDGEEDDDVE